MMFGKPHDDTDTLDSSVIDGFFGDEAATAKAVEVDQLQHRVEQVEAQISSQFTSLATYAQIAQEQVELARSEAKAATERSEQRVMSLIERERADRISSFTGQAPADSAPTSPPVSTPSNTPSPDSARVSTSAWSDRSRSPTPSP